MRGDVPALVERVRDLPAPDGVLVGGYPGETTDFRATLLDRLPLAAGLVLGATYLILFLMTGSVLLPLKATVLNLLSLAVMFGCLVWVFQDGNLSGVLGFTPTGSIEPSIPVLMFCVAYGLSMDYEVFLLSRIKEEHDRTGDTGRAVAEGIRRSAPLITAAAGILALSFLVVRHRRRRLPEGARHRHGPDDPRRRDPHPGGPAPGDDAARGARELVGAEAAAPLTGSTRRRPSPSRTRYSAGSTRDHHARLTPPRDPRRLAWQAWTSSAPVRRTPWAGADPPQAGGTGPRGGPPGRGGGAAASALAVAFDAAPHRVRARRLELRRGAASPSGTRSTSSRGSCCFGGAALLLWRQRYPVPVVFGTAATALLYLGAGYPYGPVFLTVALACFSAIVAGHRRAAWTALGMLWVGHLLVAHWLYRWLPPTGDPAAAWGEEIVVAAWMVAILAVSELARVRREQWARERARAPAGGQAARRRGAAADRPGTARRPGAQHLRHQRPGGRRPRAARLRPRAGAHRAHHHQGREQGSARRGAPGPRHAAHARRRAARPRAGPRPAPRAGGAGGGRGPHRRRRAGASAGRCRRAPTSPPSGSSRRRSPTSYGTPDRGTRACGSITTRAR